MARQAPRTSRQLGREATCCRVNTFGLRDNGPRNIGDRGIRVWGARTVSSDPSWRYINVRRLFIMVEQSIEIGTQWVVFEPNDHSLWKRVKRNISAFLLRIYNSGALTGETRRRAGGGLLRQVRRGDQPARGRRRRPDGVRDRSRPGEARRVRDLPHRPDGRRGEVSITR
jgi:hypothetical protein